MIRAALMICLALTAAPVVGYQTMPEMIESAYAELDSLARRTAGERRGTG